MAGKGKYVDSDGASTDYWKLPCLPGYRYIRWDGTDHADHFTGSSVDRQIFTIRISPGHKAECVKCPVGKYSASLYWGSSSGVMSEIKFPVTESSTTNFGSNDIWYIMENSGVTNGNADNGGNAFSGIQEPTRGRIQKDSSWATEVNAYSRKIRAHFYLSLIHI